MRGVWVLRGGGEAGLSRGGRAILVIRPAGPGSAWVLACPAGFRRIGLKERSGRPDKRGVLVPGASSPLKARPLHQRLLLLLVPLVGVLVLGTGAFAWSEGWGLEQSLYFTVITFTTVGYGDYELSEAGHRVAVLVILIGFAIFTYVLGQLVQIVVERQLDWERTMQHKADRLSDHYIIVGFGRIGQTVCERLHADGVPFVVVDRDRGLIESAVRDGYIGVVADATNDSVLRGCGIERARGLVCLTTSDANNIVITLSARALSPGLTIISRAESDDHMRKLRHAGATRVISPEQSGAFAVANSILRPFAIDFLDQAAWASGGVEFSRVTVRAGSTLEGRALGDSTADEGGTLVVVAVERADGAVRVSPPADLRLEAGDTLLIGGQPGAVVSFCTEAG